MFKLFLSNLKNEFNRQLEISKLQKRMLKILKAREILLKEAITQKDVGSRKTLLQIENEIHEYCNFLESKYELMRE